MIEIVNLQKAYFDSGATRSISSRIEALTKLRLTLKRHERLLLRAIYADLRKTPDEAYMAEIGLIYLELRAMIRHLRRWSRPRLVLPTLSQLPGYAKILHDPYGCVLILSPWNYPALLSLTPLISAIAAGNCVVLRPSSHAPKTAEALEIILRECFEEKYVSIVRGDTSVAEKLVSLPFNKIFFTGSSSVGKSVMRAASENLVPVTLELGGKCPVVVAADADIPLAARRIVWGKGLNAGQTCVAPDYVLVAKQVEQELLEALAAEITKQYGENPIESMDLPAIINDRHFERLCSLLSNGSIYCGGQTDSGKRKISPTVLTEVSSADPVMQDEIFGPILPVQPVATMESALSFIRNRPSPLALYLFSSDRSAAQRVMRDMVYGGGCINDCVLQLANSRLPFGGVGQSGMGTYHGKAGFLCFSREKSVFVGSSRTDVPLRYAPRKGLIKKLRKIMK